MELGPAERGRSRGEDADSAQTESRAPAEESGEPDADTESAAAGTESEFTDAFRTIKPRSRHRRLCWKKGWRRWTRA